MYRLAYVDDNLDIELSKYLDTRYRNDYFEFEFTVGNQYDDILNFIKENEIKIIIIDSRLFENVNSCKKFTGDEFLILLKEIYPYVQSILISANDTGNNITIKKYKSSAESLKQYKKTIENKLKNAENELDFITQTMEQLKTNDAIEPTLIEQIKNTEEKIVDYKGFNKKDIDEIVQLFKEIEDKINEWLSMYKILLNVWKCFS